MIVVGWLLYLCNMKEKHRNCFIHHFDANSTQTTSITPEFPCLNWMFFNPIFSTWLSSSVCVGVRNYKEHDKEVTPFFWILYFGFIFEFWNISRNHRRVLHVFHMWSVHSTPSNPIQSGQSLLWFRGGPSTNPEWPGRTKAPDCTWIGRALVRGRPALDWRQGPKLHKTQLRPWCQYTEFLGAWGRVLHSCASQVLLAVQSVNCSRGQ